jgi:hypothetical protein
MDLRHLREFFEERIDATALHAMIARETQLFGARMEGGETCIPLYGSHGNFQFTVRTGHIKLLCHAYLSGALSAWDTYYLCDLMMLSPAFTPASAPVEEAIYLMSDPVAQRPVSRDAARTIFFWLDEPQSVGLGQMLEPHGYRQRAAVGG